MAAALDNRWIGWVNENIARGCNPEQLLEILLKNNFAVDSIKQAMGAMFPAHSALLANLPPAQKASAISLVTPGVDHKKLSEIRITRLGVMDGVERIENPHLQLFVYKDFLSITECDELVEIIKKHLRPSTLTTQDVDKYFRTSSTCDMSLLDYAAVPRIDQKIAAALGINTSHSEGIQAQRYEVGQQFKEHTDFFESGTEEFAKYGVPKGNRTWTFMIYLNDTPKGGGTDFPKIGRTFYPKKGTAVIWNSLNADGTPNRYSAHHGMPVEEGEKIVITKWFRELGAGSMFV